MHQTEVSFPVSEQLVFSLNEDIQEFTNEVRLFSALHFYRSHKLSLGKASELADMDKFSFIRQLGIHKIPLIDYDPNELDKELSEFKNDNCS